MGGILPLGYNSHNKKLVINEEEATVVRLAFEKYLVLRSEIAVAEWLNENGYTTMSKGNNGKFTHMRVSKMLKNVLYAGKIPHKKIFMRGNMKQLFRKNSLMKRKNQKQKQNWATCSLTFY